MRRPRCSGPARAEARRRAGQRSRARRRSAAAVARRTRTMLGASVDEVEGGQGARAPPLQALRERREGAGGDEEVEGSRPGLHDAREDGPADEEEAQRAVGDGQGGHCLPRERRDQGGEGGGEEPGGGEDPHRGEGGLQAARGGRPRPRAPRGDGETEGGHAGPGHEPPRGVERPRGTSPAPPPGAGGASPGGSPGSPARSRGGWRSPPRRGRGSRRGRWRPP